MQEPVEKSWWGRNWFWVVPVGCLSPLVICGGCLAAIFFGVFGAIRASEPYRDAVAAAMGSAEVKAELGEPLEVGFWANGNIQAKNDSGSANLTIPVKGSKKSGTIDVEATREAGKWKYSKLELAPEGGGKRIDLRPDSKK